MGEGERRRAITGFEGEIRVDSTVLMVVKRAFRLWRKKLQQAVYSERNPLLFFFFWLKEREGQFVLNEHFHETVPAAFIEAVI